MTSPLVSNFKLVEQSYPQAKDADNTAVKLSSAIFPNTDYNPQDVSEMEKFITTAHHIAAPSEDKLKTEERLSQLNTHLSTRTTLLGTKPSIADVALYERLAPVAKGWTDEEKTGEKGLHNVVRWLDFVQSAPLFGLRVNEDEKVPVDPERVVAYIKPVNQKAEKERKKMEKEKEKEKAMAGGATAAAGGAAAAAAGAATNKPDSKPKEKKPKPPKPSPAAERPLSPALIDLRVGHILKAVRHPDADSLYVSTIACGDAPGTPHTSEYEGQIVRTVCSGLNGLVPLEEMQNRKIVAVCNLKPVKMRGVVSAAMVLAASPRGEDEKVVELVIPPEDAPAGEKVFFEGWEGKPEAQLNPKKKVWESCQVGFTTTEERVVGFETQAVEGIEGGRGVAELRTKQGVCRVKSLVGASVR
ncbi:nucleic acid-binding protein [Piedraia hortae CBS 480.64]|uniref:Nucleic acid-binding protein n=1 Tax=Piedraia hortae CBS 480.64 TaxID=1314780 RepID=A0A6A7C877_9PEZI|nr:nucleic acid-binding protein [Piedraia hortae CBS 480.64]